MNSVLNVYITLLTLMNQESQLFDLANDCFQFVLGFFDVIRTSAPHIYHSALLLCPKKSIVRTLYGPQVRPMARVIWGIPASWDPSIANIRFPGRISATAWSPCSRFIAAVQGDEIVILDAATFEQIHTIHLLNGKYLLSSVNITFSPGSHLLTAYCEETITSWDLQTGGLLSNMDNKTHFPYHSITYSRCETMVAGASGHGHIDIYNIPSGIYVSSHKIPCDIVKPIWTLGKYLQFATIKPGSIIMWQISFTSKQAPKRVGSLSTPDNFSKSGLVLLPTLSRLAFILGNEVVVWDSQHHKVLLHSRGVLGPKAMSFSSNGCFFVCGTKGREFHIWKESPTGYVLHQKLISGADWATPLVSPNGELVISSGGNRFQPSKMLQLWHMTNPSTSFSGTLMQASQHMGDFCVEFSPDESLVAFTDMLGRTVIILDMKSGNSWLAIDTGIRICGLKMTEDTIIVVGDGKVVTWGLPARGCVENARRNINSIQSTTIKHSAHYDWLHASISPNLKYIAIVDKECRQTMFIYDMYTGKKLAVATSVRSIAGFTSSGHVWCAGNNGGVDQWEIVEEDGSDAIKLKKLGIEEKPPNDYYWNAPDGYKVTDNGWIISPSGEWLLWLPHRMQPGSRIQMKWSGKFIAVWNGNSTEPCILDFGV